MAAQFVTAKQIAEENEADFMLRVANNDNVGQQFACVVAVNS